MKVINVVGARPNFMKVAPLHRAFKAYPHIESKVVHTGQHYDERMSEIFFNQLELPVPDYYLGVGSGSHAQITAKIMIEFEKIMEIEKPDLVLVVGDVNSTLACALVAKKMHIKLAHIEAGLRSGDGKMPEETNRIVTDSISDYLFVTEQSGMVNLAREGAKDKDTFFVGNVMIDSLCHYREKAAEIKLLQTLNVSPHDYVLLTLHRPSNVDRAEKLETIIDVIKRVSQHRKVVFPIHPRTLKNLKRFHLFDTLASISNLIILEPQGYLEFLHLMDNCALIITDSGGIQEESTFLKKPCLTIRNSTERPVTITLGTNVLIPELDADLIIKKFYAALNGELGSPTIPPLWDGQSAKRIVRIINNLFENVSEMTMVRNRPFNV